tara:strand:- start:14235 stop:16709 length:2475 start_codon:yes stop_codon:yes gene_type:complete
MASKKVYRIRSWKGGLNTYVEPGELKEDELVDALGIDMSQDGRIKTGGHFLTDADAFPGTSGDSGSAATTTVIPAHANAVHPEGGSSFYIFHTNSYPGLLASHISGWNGSADGTESQMRYHNGSALATTAAADTPQYAGLTNHTGDVAVTFEFRGDNSTSGGKGAWVGLRAFDGSNYASGGALGASVWGNLSQSVATVSHENVKLVAYNGGNSFYVADGNIESNAENKNRLIFRPVDRIDFPQSGTPITISKYVVGPAILMISSDQGEGSGVNNFVHDDSTPLTDSDQDGEVTILADDSGDGNWSGDFNFYMTVLYDDGVESNMATLGTNKTFSADYCAGQISIRHSATNPVLGNYRIHGFRVYWEDDEAIAPRFLLFEADFQKGVRIEGEENWRDWTLASGEYKLASTLVIDSPPMLRTYEDINGYRESDITEYETGSYSTGALRYRTACVASDGRAYIGNISYGGKNYPSRMLYSETFKYGLFPTINYLETTDAVSSPIMHLESAGDRVFQFTTSAINVFNVSTEEVFLEQVFHEFGGVSESRQVCRIPGGVAFGNSTGFYVYKEDKFIDVLEDKIDKASTLKNTPSGVGDYLSDTASLGYDSNTQDVIYLSSAGDGTTVATKQGLRYNLKTEGVAKFYFITQIKVLSNFANDKLGDLYVRDYSNGSIDQADTGLCFKYGLGGKAGATDPGTGNECQSIIQSGRLHLENPGGLKTLYEVRFYVSGSTDDGIDWNSLKMRTDKSGGNWRVLSQSKTSQSAGNLGANSSPAKTDNYLAFYPDYNNKSEFKKFRYIEYYFEAEHGADTAFSIDEIQLIYRDLKKV